MTSVLVGLRQGCLVAFGLGELVCSVVSRLEMGTLCEGWLIESRLRPTVWSGVVVLLRRNNSGIVDGH